MKDMSEHQGQQDRTEPVLDLHIVDGVDEEVVSIARQYWGLKGFDREGLPLWKMPVRAINTERWGRAHVVAAVGVRAVVVGRACPHCTGPLTLSSRGALGRLCLGDPPVPCVACNERMQARIARIPTTPALRPAAPRSRGGSAGQTLAHSVVIRPWREEILQERHPRTFTPEMPIPDAEVVDEVIALALLRGGTSRLGPVERWPLPLHAAADEVAERLGAAMRAGLFRIDPASPVEAFDWTPAIGQSDTEPRMTGRYFPLKAVHYVPFGDTAPSAAAALDSHLMNRLDPALMTSSRRLELVDLLVDVIAAEAVRYAQHEVARAGFRAIEEDCLLNLRTALRSAARLRSLGELYNLAWRSVANAKKQQRAPTATTTLDVVEQIETLAARAARDLDWEIRAFNSVSNLELAASTRVLFDVILDANPYTDTSAVLDEHLPDPHVGVLPPRKHTRSDFNSLACAVCHIRVPARQVWIWVDIRHAVILSKTNADDLDDVLERLARDDVTPSSWQVGHQDCLAAEGASHETALPTTYRELLGWAGDLLLQRRWSTHTDLPQMLTEAATLTGRFAPGD